MSAPIRYLSVCSGIEAVTVATEPLGWEPAAFSEIEPFPSRVLAHHWPEVPNLGDFTKIRAADVGPIDLLVGGTPCQAFSIAGLREGLDDPRGGLTLEFIRLAERTRPRWIWWENVPGVLSQDRGRAFGSLLGGLAELGYGFAWRVLDAQFFGVPQRRRRVFLVGCLGDSGAAPAAVLFEPESVRRHLEKGGKARARAPVTSRRAGGAHEAGDGVRGRVSHNDTVPASVALRGRDGGATAELGGSKSYALRASQGGGSAAYALVPVPFTFDTTQITSPHNRSNPRPGDPCHTLPAKGHPPALAYSIPPESGQGADLRVLQPEIAGTLTATYSNLSIYDVESGNYPLDALGIRRLTPLECERLQGFPDGHTAIPGAKDAPRYKAIGNSMAVPVMRWIARRLQYVDQLLRLCA